MKSIFLTTLMILGAILTLDSCAGAKPNPVVVLETSEGTIEVELFPNVAPKHVANFLKLTREGFYDSLIFHRVIDGFMIQTGDPEGTGMGGSGTKIPAEFNDSTHHLGTLGMARSQDPNSASSQFYICVAPAPHLDKKYTVFGKTIKGIEIVQKIGKVPTSGNMSRIMRDAAWKQELVRMKNDEKADVLLDQGGNPAPDRPLKTVYLLRAYEKK